MTNQVYQYNFPTTIRFGAGASSELGDYLIKQGLKKPLIVTDNNVVNLSFFKNIQQELLNKNISCEVNNI